MKVIFLNTWYGKLNKKLLEFIERESKDTDIFCFQEVDRELYKILQNKLVGHNGSVAHKGEINNLIFDIATFVKNDFKILNKVTNLQNKKTGGFLVTEISVNNKLFVLCNVHGLSMPGDKLDTEERIEQSKEVISQVSKFESPIIVGGDFNLLPDTKSIKMFEELGYQNLIKEFGIKETRNRIAWETLKNEEGFINQHFADYCFVSRAVKVKSFEVPNIEVSDHLPLILKFEI